MFTYKKNHAICSDFNNYILPYKLSDVMFITMKHICSRNSWNVLARIVYTQDISTKDYTVYHAYHTCYYILMSPISYWASRMLTPSTFSISRYYLGSQESRQGEVIILYLELVVVVLIFCVYITHKWCIWVNSLPLY
jgi:hypothetical protein